MSVRRAVALTVAAFAIALGVPAVASAAPGEGGWVRLTHLSPDSPPVDVQLTAAGDPDPLISESDLAYGSASDYTRVPAGIYVARMIPVSGSPSSIPTITQSVTVADGGAYTVAAVGRTASLTGVVLTDDLTPPPAGQARVRLLQASVNHPSVTVTAIDGPVLAADAAFAGATGYAQIPAGQWSLSVDADGTRVGSATGVRVEPGSVNTLIVLDAADGSVNLVALQDAVGAEVTPAGGVETGGGGTAPGAVPSSPSSSWGPVALAGVVLAGGLAAPVLQRRRAVVIRTSPWRALAAGLLVVAVAGCAGASPTDAGTAGSSTSASATEELPGPQPLEDVQVDVVRVQVPAIGVDATPLEPLGLLPDGSLAAPADFGQAGWFADGTVPGNRGPAVIAGHVDSVAGPAVFYRLRDLVAGDQVLVGLSDGRTLTFQVDRTEQAPKDAFPTEEVYGPTPDSQLRLITCGGVFDRSVRSYEDNTIVFASLVT